MAKDDDVKRLTLALPPDLKAGIEEMAEATKMNQSQLLLMAAHSLVANWKAKGSFIFVDLLNPGNNKSDK